MAYWKGDEAALREALAQAVHVPVEVARDEDLVTVKITLLGGSLPWTKAFALPIDMAHPDNFLDMYREWRGNMLAKLASLDISPVFRAVLSTFGHEKVQYALTRQLYSQAA